MEDELLFFRGFWFPKSGEFWGPGHARLSPDGALLALLSWRGRVAQRDDFILYLGRDKGKLFYDIFNADTGKKLLTIVAKYLDIDPGHAVIQSIWVTERYFIVPLGEHRERALVCDFGRAARK